ncbi:RNA polymerase sigma factor [Actinomadura roseirufa]|uniref:RNA polymerase sigma factor n=1 Tax=Actinomadura roseirufa TaxID=2094049 RepID=UPI0013F16F3A|nr:sigma-70 family RNA polymerase sigma factor [Actinomadura roseirufa]
MTALFKAESPGLFRYALTIPSVSRADADDLVQATFQDAVLAWEEKLSCWTGERRRKWLFQVLRNKAIDQWRKDRHVCSASELIEGTAASFQDTSHRALSNIALRRCWSVIKLMPPVRQRVAFLRWGEDWKPREIAALLGISQDTVRAHLKRARDALAVQVGPQVPFIDSYNAEEGTER